MLREDSNQPFWKGKFLTGLPTLFGEKVRTEIQEHFGTNQIPYQELTYGELVSFTQREGLKICQDLKLQKHLKWEMKKTIKEVGSFCQQFDITRDTSRDCGGNCKIEKRLDRKSNYRFRKFKKHKKKDSYYKKTLVKKSSYTNKRKFS